MDSRRRGARRGGRVRAGLTSWRWRVAAAAGLVGVVGLVLALTLQRHAKADHVPRIGFLGIDSRMQAERVAAFNDGLRTLGYVDGRNVHIEYRYAEGQFERLPALAKELVTAKVDVIVTAAPPAVRAARQATQTVPIVMAIHDPVGMGMAKSLAHPGGNVTGLAFQDAELSSKRLDLLREAVPGLTRVAILWNREGSGEHTTQAVEAAARELGIQTIVLEVNAVPDFAVAVAKAKAWGAQGVIQLAAPFITTHRSQLLAALALHRLPATCELREYVVDGCLMTYSADLNAMFRRMANFVDLILKGVDPGSIAIEQPRDFVFAVNGRTAASLGLDVPPALRFQLSEPPL